MKETCFRSQELQTQTHKQWNGTLHEQWWDMILDKEWRQILNFNFSYAPFNSGVKLNEGGAGAACYN